jgi:Protein of unknown function (DUF2004)
MSAINHHYFGDLHRPGTETDVIWEREFALNDSRFKVSLWMSPSEQFDASTLDAFAVLLGDLNALDTVIDYHTEELQDSDVIGRLIAAASDREIEAEAFVAAMPLNRIGLWIGTASSPVVVDYVIDAENSDQILAVKAEQNGTVVSIDWES